MLEIDGTTGEGGGQILRTSLALSAVTGIEFRLVDIRRKRSKPGLKRQHLTCVQAAAAVCNADVRGARLNATEIEFRPGQIAAGDFEFAIGTAGSTTLVLQTILPALAVADSPSTVRISGGTHNPMAPTTDFLRDTFAPQLARLGPALELATPSLGFYPAGGGVLEADIKPMPRESWRAFELLERGDIVNRRCTALVAHIPRDVAEREIVTFTDALSWPAGFGKVAVEDDRSPGPGNVFTAQFEAGAVTETFTALGQRGVRAEAVAAEVAKMAKKYLASGAPVGEYLADQLVLLFALAGGGRFRTVAPSLHTLTQLEIIPKFLEVDISAERVEDSVWEIEVS